MPMDPKYPELEMDSIEAGGSGRVWQEMAKNPALPGDNVSPTHPGGLHKNLIAHKKRKTRKAVDTGITQVIRRSVEG